VEDAIEEVTGISRKIYLTTIFQP